MKYRMNPTAVDTHLQVLKAKDICTPRCGRCRRILPSRWHGHLCSSCTMGQDPEARHDR